MVGAAGIEIASLLSKSNKDNGVAPAAPFQLEPLGASWSPGYRPELARVGPSRLRRCIRPILRDQLLQVGVVFFLEDETGFADPDESVSREACQSARWASDDRAGVVSAVHRAFGPDIYGV